MGHKIGNYLPVPQWPDEAITPKSVRLVECSLDIIGSTLFLDRVGGKRFADNAISHLPMTYVEYEGPLRLPDMYGIEKLARLREVKRKYDKENRLRFNANIPPT